MKVTPFLVFMVTMLITSASFSMEKVIGESVPPKETSKSAPRTDELKTSLLDVYTRLEAIREELGQANIDLDLLYGNAHLFANSSYKNTETFNVPVDVPLITQRERALTHIENIFKRVTSLCAGSDSPMQVKSLLESSRTGILRTLKKIKEIFDGLDGSLDDQPRLRETFKKQIETIEKDSASLFFSYFIEKVGSVVDTPPFDEKIFALLKLLYDSENQTDFSYDQKSEWFQDVCGWLRKCPDALKEDNQPALHSFTLFREKSAQLRQQAVPLLEEKKRLKKVLEDADEYSGGYYGGLQKLITSCNLPSVSRRLQTFKRKKLNIQLIDSPYAILFRKFDLKKAFEQDRIKAFLLLQDIMYWLQENRQMVEQLIQRAEQDPTYPFEDELYRAYLAHREQCFTIQNQQDVKIALRVLQKSGYNLNMSEAVTHNVLLTEPETPYEAAFFGILLYNHNSGYFRSSDIFETFYREDINLYQVISAARQLNLVGIIGTIFWFCEKNGATHTLVESMPLGFFQGLGGKVDPPTLIKVLVSKVKSIQREQKDTKVDPLQELETCLSELAPRLVLANGQVASEGERLSSKASHNALKTVLREGVLAEALSEKVKRLMKKLVVFPSLSKPHGIREGELYCYQNLCVAIKGPNVESSKKEDTRVCLRFYQSEKVSNANTARSYKKFSQRIMPHNIVNAILVYDQLYACDVVGKMQVFHMDEIIQALIQNRAPTPRKELPINGSLCPEARKHGWYAYTDSINGQKSLRVVLSFIQPDGKTCLQLYNGRTSTLLSECTVGAMHSITVTPQYCIVHDGEKIVLLNSETLIPQKTISIPGAESVGAVCCTKDTLFIIPSADFDSRTMKMYSYSLNTDNLTSVILPTLGNESSYNITLLHSLGDSHLLAVSSTAIFVIDSAQKTIIKQFRAQAHTCKPFIVLTSKDNIYIVYTNLEAFILPKKRLVEDESSDDVDKAFAQFIAES